MNFYFKNVVLTTLFIKSSFPKNEVYFRLHLIVICNIRKLLVCCKGKLLSLFSARLLSSSTEDFKQR